MTDEPKNPVTFVTREAKHIANSLANTRALGEQLSLHAVNLYDSIQALAELPPTAQVDFEPDCSKCISLLTRLRASLQKLLQNDGNYAEKHDMEYGPFVGLLKLENRKNILDYSRMSDSTRHARNDAINASRDELLAILGIRRADWQNWMEKVMYERLKVEEQKTIAKKPDELIGHIMALRIHTIVEAAIASAFHNEVIPNHCLKVLTPIIDNLERTFSESSGKEVFTAGRKNFRDRFRYCANDNTISKG